MSGSVPENTLPATSAAPVHDSAAPPAFAIGGDVRDPGASIRPFRVETNDEALADLRRRILATNFPDRETVEDATQGVQLGVIGKLAAYWATDYDWRRCEARLNALPQYLTEIDGLDIHFIHVRSPHPDALPLIVTHGWPGSIVEQLKIIGPLTDPPAHGGSAADAFDIVIPSMPGYGYSARPTGTGWDPPRIARAWTTLMRRLGYDRFVAQGGDWGALVTETMGVQRPPELVAIHTNMPSAVPPEIWQALPSHTPPPGLSADELFAFERLDFFFTHGLAYAQEMGSRPQTLYGIADSPIGLAAWFLDHDLKSYELIARVFDGENEGLTRDDVLDNITVTWLTNTAISAARLYWENKTVFFQPLGVEIPVAISAFRDELYQCPRSWAERTYSRLLHYSRHDVGCHFAAWEQPALLSADLWAAFRPLR
ncbi:epoxide hydrolase family protein [Sphingosinicella terrae]|uniref:epoxide hydrolase family protein n=1 Tax=Sphingosinicella terrae TaxID=2172047 RepID=UPI000E0D812E|nr:epoxide hydrolase [Sphingosinicella terrae]